MSAQTTNYQIPYASPTDIAGTYPALDESSAKKLDSILNDTRGKVNANTAAVALSYTQWANRGGWGGYVAGAVAAHHVTVFVDIKRLAASFSKGVGDRFDVITVPSTVPAPPNQMCVGTLVFNATGRVCPVYYDASMRALLIQPVGSTITVNTNDYIAGTLHWSFE